MDGWMRLTHLVIIYDHGMYRWQTETGAVMIAPLPIKGWVQKPGSATLPFFGVLPVLLTPEGEEIHGMGEGLLAIKSAWPSTIRSVHGDHDRMESTYFSFPGYYLTGDNARRDHDGYFWITGRADGTLLRAIDWKKDDEQGGPWA